MLGLLRNISNLIYRPPRWNYSTRIEQPYVPNGITARCGQNNNIARPKTCKPKPTRSSFCSPQRQPAKTSASLNKTKSRSTHNCLELPKHQIKNDSSTTFNQSCAASSIAISMSTSSSNLSVTSRISSASSLSAKNAYPPLEIVGTSTRLSPSPLSSNGCTSRGSKCNNNIEEKDLPESATGDANAHTLTSGGNLNEYFTRPKSSSVLEKINRVIENNTKIATKIEKEENIRISNNQNNAKLEENGNSDSHLDAFSQSRLSPTKRGERRIRSREIIEALQIQVTA